VGLGALVALRGQPGAVYPLTDGAEKIRLFTY